MNDQLWADVEERIAEIAKRIFREEIEKNLPVSQIAPLVWMTEAQLAGHWQMMTVEGKAKVAAIRKWTARPPDQHPLPCVYMGDLRRYHRKEVDQWVREETERQRLKRRQKKLRLVE